jgi:hypothetical protein
MQSLSYAAALVVSLISTLPPKHSLVVSDIPTLVAS